MRTARLCLLLLLAALLPLRGAMAAALLCPQAGSSIVAEHAVSTGGEEHAHHQHAGAHHDDHHDHDHGAQDSKCNLCSAFCSATPLPSEAPTLPVPPAPSTSSFPALAAPAPSFVSGGPERPPRSI